MAENKKSDRLIQILSVLKNNDVVHGISPAKLRKVLEELGPTFVKFGQIMSMRADLIPESYCEELSRLRSEVMPMDFEEVKGIIKAEYGIDSIKEVFYYIEPTPLGSASIAQVHKAVLKDGTSVVVKVQRSGIRQKMYNDIVILKKAILLLKLKPSLGNPEDYVTILEELWSAAKQEMDFLIEASYLEEFRKLNADINYVYCPKVDKNLTTSHVLVMENITGVPITEKEKLEKLGYDSKEIASKLAKNYSKQILDDGFFHADPHPGNLFVCDEKIVWLDFGMMGRLTARDKKLIINSVRAISENDIYQLKNIVLSMGVVRQKVNHAQLYEDIEQVVNKYSSMDFASINLGNAVMEINNVAVRHNIGIPKGFAMLARGIITIESVLAELNPDINFIEIISMHLLEEDIDWKKEFQKVVFSSVGAIKRGIDLPKYVSDILEMTAKGQIKLNLDFIGSEQPLSGIDKMIDKLVVSIICAGLLIGSSLICTTDMSGRLFGIPALGVIGFSLSMVLGVWLVYEIIRHKNK